MPMGKSRRLRDHLKDKPRVPWLYAASLAARREYQVMEKLYSKVSIPRPVAISRHALAMEYVPGPLLNRITLEDPEDGLRLILGEVGRALGQGIIHADLSEFNILYDDGEPVIIDMGQSVTLDHPMVRKFLERDIVNLTHFFRKKYAIGSEEEIWARLRSDKEKADQEKADRHKGTE